jgi:hypothetical protein
MKKNPGRKDRRKASHEKKKGDINRNSIHRMRSNHTKIK